MKKTAIALAISAATASAVHAQNITIDGYIDRAVEVRNSTLSTSDRTIISSSSGTSTIGFSGSEDLGGGLRASFRINTDFADLAGANVDNSNAFTNWNTQGAGFANSQLWLGLSSKDMGELRLGTVNNETLTAVTAVAQPAFSTGVGSIYSSSFSVHAGYTSGTAGYVGSIMHPTKVDTTVGYAGARSIRQKDSVYYYAPTVAGFKFSAGVVVNNDKGGSDDNTGVTEYALRYTQGAVDLMYANIKYEVGSVAPGQAAAAHTALVANSSSTNQTFGGAITLSPALKINAGYFTSKSNGIASPQVDQTASSVGASYNLTAATTLMGVIAQVNDKSTDNMDRNFQGIGVNYAMSKRTRAYLRWDKIETDEGRRDVAGNRLSRTAVGIAHTF